MQLYLRPWAVFRARPLDNLRLLGSLFFRLASLYSSGPPGLAKLVYLFPYASILIHRHYHLHLLHLLFLLLINNRRKKIQQIKKQSPTRPHRSGIFPLPFRPFVYPISLSPFPFFNKEGGRRRGGGNGVQNKAFLGSRKKKRAERAYILKGSWDYPLDLLFICICTCMYTASSREQGSRSGGTVPIRSSNSKKKKKKKDRERRRGEKAGFVKKTLTPTPTPQSPRMREIG